MDDAWTSLILAARSIDESLSVRTFKLFLDWLDCGVDWWTGWPVVICWRSRPLTRACGRVETTTGGWVSGFCAANWDVLNARGGRGSRPIIEPEPDAETIEKKK